MPLASFQSNGSYKSTLLLTATGSAGKGISCDGDFKASGSYTLTIGTNSSSVTAK